MRACLKSAAVGPLLVLLGATASAADQADQVAQGEEIFMDVCLACHGPSAQGPDRIAPPIFAAKNHYAAYTEREAFVSAMSAYVLAPNERTTRMPGAIRRFGLMPEQGLTEEEARAAAEYVFATDFSVPDWYAKHYQEEHGEAPPGN